MPGLSCCGGGGLPRLERVGVMRPGSGVTPPEMSRGPGFN